MTGRYDTRAKRAAAPLPGTRHGDRGESMKSRDVGILLFGLAGLYSLLLALVGLAQLLPELARGSQVVAGQWRIQAVFVNSAVSVGLHLAFGWLLLSGRGALADRLLGETGSAESAAGSGRDRGGTGRERGAAAGEAVAGAEAQGVAAAGVCGVAILLVARVVPATAYGVSVLLAHDNTGDLMGWTAAGILVDLLLALTGLLLLARCRGVASRLTAPPAAGARRRDVPRPPAAWDLAAVRFLGLVMVVWHLPALASAISTFVKWWLRPVGFDLRIQAIDSLPPAAVGILAGLYLLLLFPAGLRGVARRLHPARDPEVK
jgi:hypothetical protein